MSFPLPETVRTGIPSVDRQNDAFRELFRLLTDSLIADGRLIENVSLTSGTNATIGHKLGRTPLGYWIVDKTAYVDLQTVSKSNATLVVTPNATSTVTLWVF